MTTGCSPPTPTPSNDPPGANGASPTFLTRESASPTTQEAPTQTSSDAVPQATPDPSQFGFTRQITVAADPDTVYDLISDVTNISRWSPTADSVYYDEGHGPTAGAWFSGMNHRNGKSWPSRSQVERANRPEMFSFVVGGLHDGIVRWRWTFSPGRDGTTVASLTWSLLRLDPVLGASAAEILELQDFMASSVHTTLNALARYLQRVCPHLG